MAVVTLVHVTRERERELSIFSEFVKALRVPTVPHGDSVGRSDGEIRGVGLGGSLL